MLYAALAAACVAPALAQHIAVAVGQPGFYGQIDIGGYPQPELVYPQPMVVQPSPQYAEAPPVYLHVPPGHEKHWNKHCAEYHACNRRVYFVKDDWYNHEYVPQYHHHEHEHHHEND
jgi:hypothetical protein